MFRLSIETYCRFIVDPKLVRRYIDGAKVGNYKEVDYEKLKALTKIKHYAGERSLKKLENITKSTKQKKGTQLLQQHKAVWHKTMNKLKHMQEQIQNEISLMAIKSDTYKSNSFMTDLHVVDELDEFEESLTEDQEQFITATVTPVWDLREDLQCWVEENREKLILGIAAEEHSKVMDVVYSVKKQQEGILEKLSIEEKTVEDAIHDCMADLGIEVVDLKLPHLSTGVPQEALFLDCPSEELRERSLEEFVKLDHKYKLHFTQLEEKYDDILNRYEKLSIVLSLIKLESFYTLKNTE